ncbi:MAG: CinA family protein [Legionella sp.]|nr:MAG: CinA family protein [Legionella sp.]
MISISNLVNDIAQLLKAQQGQLVTAESCTGGLIGASLTDMPGSSLWYERGFITYSNLAKKEMLGVPEQLLKKFGAVSIEVAIAMAEGALQHSQGTIALSVTGIAGPSGGTPDKPVGTVCFAWLAANGTAHTLKKCYPGDRHAIRLAACQEALQGVLSLLKEIH